MKPTERDRELAKDFHGQVFGDPDSYMTEEHIAEWIAEHMAPEREAARELISLLHRSCKHLPTTLRLDMKDALAKAEEIGL